MREPSMPSLPLLRAFNAVAEHKSITKAAASLHRTQPALTISIGKLERLLGVSLVERGRSGARLTSAGILLSRRMRRMLDRLDAALAEIAAIPDGVSWAKRITDVQARSIAALADCDTIEQSAVEIGVTAVSLRRTIQSIERLVGKSLVQPVARGIGPSKLGAQLARRMKLALGEIAAAIEEIEIARGRIRSRIAIGVVPLSATRLLTLAINDLLVEYPDASVAIAHGSYEPLLDDLRAARIDMLYGVLRLPSWNDDVKEEPLFFDPYVIAVRKNHPLTKLRRLTLNALARFDWIAPKLGTPRRQNLQRMFEDCSWQPKIAIETSSLEVQRSFLLSSDRVTLLTRREMEAEAATSGLVALSFAPRVMRGHDGVATRIDWLPTPVQARFLELLRVHCRDHSGLRNIAPEPRSAAAPDNAVVT